MYKTLPLLALLLCATATPNAMASDDHHDQALAIYRHAISLRTAQGHGKVPELAKYLAGQFRAAGFPEQDIHVLPVGETAALVVRYRGDGSAGKKPVSISAHMDVVDALPEDWERDPFTLTKENGYYYGRGTADNKLGLVATSAIFLRLKAEGFVPARDLILAFSGDEETDMASTKALVGQYRELTDSEYSLNADMGGGSLAAPGGAPVSYDIQAAEKTYITYELRVTSPGGHSSRPTQKNAIYDLAGALVKLQDYDFPVRQNDLTRQYFAAQARRTPGELGAAMAAFADNPGDADAVATLRTNPAYTGLVSTTCVATMLDAGHAENALPQTAMAVVNCRLFPGEGVEATAATLARVIDNPEIAVVQRDEATETDASPLREDLLAALRLAVDANYPGLEIVPYMSTGGSDGMHFRAAGIPSYGVDGLYMWSGDNYNHGLNERIPVDAFDKELRHWYVLLKAIGRPQD
ncbi:M20/M25/M40 family metallo-hydrolase [Mangrovimicrobium sediminis]|uniref:M20/M25/M40 family metallo-hydrolase n=1 Tax=Mangrovimicrobium sediminis TaxID=2562682 RepID=A0A4Z0M7V2_9GAMM|nr:M20/M25/M40 family metallo-hydrolase [Haliea sp. SAOS-164]TGD75476.1 M20/M25/M40 family metallo-hydrolase [Haliea sp. SAOS-164]